MIRIITDSLCDLTMDYAKELNIDIMPLTVRFGEDDFKCGIDLTNEAFYDKLTNDSNNPSTAAVNPFEFEEIFKKYIDAGDEVVAVLFSKYMSATFQSASIAAENINSDRLYLIDCETGAMGQGLLVETAVTLRNEGKSAKEIADILNVRESTLKFHNHNILEKLGVSSRKQMLRFATLLKQETLNQ